MGNTSLSAVDLTQTYRLMSTAALLTGSSAFAILGNETIRKAESTTVEVPDLIVQPGMLKGQSYPVTVQGILDAVAASLASGMQPEPVREASIVASKGLPLNPECVTKATALQTDVCSRSLSRAAVKGIGEIQSMTLSVRAEGTAAYDGVYVVNSSLRRAGNATATSSVEQEFTSAATAAPSFGLQIGWANESGATRVDLSYNQQAVQFASAIRFQQLGCDESGVEASQCPADGDTVTATIRFGPRDDASVLSESTVTMGIEAKPSCSRSAAQSSLHVGQVNSKAWPSHTTNT